MSDSTKPSAPTRTKTRSPNYPAISLEEAVQRLKVVYDEQQMYPASRETFAKLMGYGGLHGASASIVSALSKYGLLEGHGDTLRVSDMGRDLVLHRRGDPEYTAALHAAAIMPAFFRELRDQYPHGLPSEHHLRTSLIKRGFNAKSVDNAVRAYRDTIQFVEAETGEPVVEPNVRTAAPRPSGLDPAYGRTAAPSQSATGQPTGIQSGADKVLTFNIAEDAEARIEFRGRVTQEAIDKLIKLLELQQDTFPRRDALPSPTAHASPNSDRLAADEDNDWPAA